MDTTESSPPTSPRVDKEVEETEKEKDKDKDKDKSDSKSGSKKKDRKEKKEKKGGSILGKIKTLRNRAKKRINDTISGDDNNNNNNAPKRTRLGVSSTVPSAQIQVTQWIRNSFLDIRSTNNNNVTHCPHSIQYDYLACYLDFYNDSPALARTIASK